MPTHNRARYLKRAVESVLGQTYNDFELIIIDDGSTDNTESVAKSFADSRIRYDYQEPCERSAARNRGTSLAKGTFIAYMDDDDLWQPSLIASCLKPFGPQNVGVVYAGWKCIDELGLSLPQPPFRPRTRGNVLRELLVGRLFFHAALVRRECLEEIGGFDERYRIAEDWDLWIRIASRGYEFDYVEEPHALYRVHATNTVLDLDAVEQGSAQVLEEAFRRLPGRPEQGDKAEAFGRLYLGHAVKRFGAGEAEKGSERFERAVQCYPTLLSERATFYQIICAMQPDGYKGTNEMLDLVLGRRYIEGALTASFTDCVSLRSRRALAFGNAFLTVAKLHYGKREMAAARHYFCLAVRTSPNLLTDRETLLTWSKAFFPRRMIRFFSTRRMVNHPR